MLKLYKPRHLKAKEKISYIYDFIIISIMILSIAFYDMCGILSYFTSKDSIVNNISLAETYTVRFNANNGTGNMPNQEMFVYLSTTLNSNTFTRSGYEFIGWNTAANGSGTSYTNAQSVTNLTTANSTIDLYAQWNQLAGVAVINGVYYPTLQAAVNAVPTNSVQTEITLLTDVDESITVKNNQNIVFDLQNHTVTNSSTKATITNSGTILIQNGTLTKAPSLTYAVLDNTSTGIAKITGGTIRAVGSNKSQAIYNAGDLEISGNPYISSESTNRATISSVNGGTVTITGGTIISVNEHAVTNIKVLSDDTDGGTIVIGSQDGSLDISTPVIQGKKNGVNAIANSVELYDGILKGYNKAINNQAYIVNNENGCSIDTGTEVINGLTYKTLYLSINNQVTFDPNGGSVSPGFKYVNVGDPLGTLPTATWAGHLFKGWYTDPVNGVQVTSSTLAGSGDIYYAHWVDACTITFNPTLGSVDPTSKEVEINTTAGALPTPTRSGFIFDGWFTTDSGGTEITANTVITQSLTVFAHWTESTVRVTFNPNLGTVSEGFRDLDVGDEIGPLPVPDRTGYAFAGWFTDPADGQGRRINENEIITADTDYYAHWITNPVAQLGPVNYLTVQEAIRDVPTNNTAKTIYLLQSSKEAVEVIPNQTVVLDLQGYTLYNDGTKKINSIIGTDARAVVIENFGTLTVTNGTVSSTASQAAINNNENLVIDGATVSNTGSRQAIYNNGGTVEITGNAYISCSASDRATIQGNKPTGSQSAGTITIYSGTIVSNTSTTKSAVENPSTGVLNVLGGNIISNNNFGIENKGTLNLGNNDGTIDDTSPVVQGETYGIKSSVNTSTFNFYDGIVKGVTDSISGSISTTETGATRVDSMDNNYHVTYYQ